MKTILPMMRFSNQNHNMMSETSYLKKMGIIMLIPLMLVSCQKKEISDITKEPEEPPKTSPLSKQILNQGIWVNSCYELQDEDGESYYYEDSFSFSGDEFFFTSIQYFDSGCSPEGEFFDEEISGVFSFSPDNKLILNANSFEFTILNQDLIDFSNEQSFCGISDWEIYATRDIEGLNCGDENFSYTYNDSTEIVDAFRLQNDDLYIYIDGNKYESYAQAQ
jgi:hypothetical protein